MATARDLSETLTTFRVAADSPMTLETWERAALACTAYLVATTLTAPLDRVKTTLQSNPNLSRAGARATASMIIRQDGMSGLFRGLGPALAMAPAVALQYTLMDELGQTRINPLAASLVVGTIDVVARAPFENVKVALQGGEIIQFEIDDTHTLNEHAKREMGYEVLCLAIQPIPYNRAKATFLAVGGHVDQPVVDEVEKRLGATARLVSVAPRVRRALTARRVSTGARA